MSSVKKKFLGKLICGTSNKKVLPGSPTTDLAAMGRVSSGTSINMDSQPAYDTVTHTLKLRNNDSTQKFYESMASIEEETITSCLNMKELDESYVELTFTDYDCDDLWEYLAKYAKSNDCIYESDILHIINQIVSIIKTLHSHRIVHLNINPSAFRCLEDRIVLTKVDNAMYVSDNETYHIEANTINQLWCLPPGMETPTDSLSLKGMQLKALDIWQVGVLSFMMMHGFVPKSQENIRLSKMSNTTREILLQLTDHAYDSRYWSFHDLQEFPSISRHNISFSEDYNIGMRAFQDNSSDDNMQVNCGTSYRSKRKKEQKKLRKKRKKSQEDEQRFTRAKSMDSMMPPNREVTVAPSDIDNYLYRLRILKRNVLTKIGKDDMKEDSKGHMTVTISPPEDRKTPSSSEEYRRGSGNSTNSSRRGSGGSNHGTNLSISFASSNPHNTDKHSRIQAVSGPRLTPLSKISEGSQSSRDRESWEDHMDGKLKTVKDRRHGAHRLRGRRPRERISRTDVKRRRERGGVVGGSFSLEHAARQHRKLKKGVPGNRKAGDDTEAKSDDERIRDNKQRRLPMLSPIPVSGDSATPSYKGRAKIIRVDEDRRHSGSSHDSSRLLPAQPPTFVHNSSQSSIRIVRRKSNKDGTSVSSSPKPEQPIPPPPPKTRPRTRYPKAKKKRRNTDSDQMAQSANKIKNRPQHKAARHRAVSSQNPNRLRPRQTRRPTKSPGTAGRRPRAKRSIPNSKTPTGPLRRDDGNDSSSSSSSESESSSSTGARRTRATIEAHSGNDSDSSSSSASSNTIHDF